MTIAPDFLTHLAARNRLSEVAAERVRRVQLETSDRLAPVLLKLGLLSEPNLAAEMAAYSGYQCLSPEALLQRADVAELAVTENVSSRTLAGAGGQKRGGPRDRVLGCAR